MSEKRQDTTKPITYIVTGACSVLVSIVLTFVIIYLLTDVIPSSMIDEFVPQAVFFIIVCASLLCMGIFCLYRGYKQSKLSNTKIDFSKTFNKTSGILFCILALLSCWSIMKTLENNHYFSLSILLDMFQSISFAGMVVAIFMKKKLIITVSAGVLAFSELIYFFSLILSNLPFLYVLSITFPLIIAYSLTALIAVDEKHFKKVWFLPAVFIVIRFMLKPLNYIGFQSLYNILFNLLLASAFLFTCMWIWKKPQNEQENTFAEIIFYHKSLVKFALIVFSIFVMIEYVYFIIFSNLTYGAAGVLSLSLLTVLIIAFIVAWFWIDKIFKKQIEVIRELAGKEALQRKEDRKIFVNTIEPQITLSSDNKYNSYDFSEADRIFKLNFSRVGINFYTRPIVEKPTHTDSAIMGGIANGLAGPAAGVYTALKTEQKNLEEKERYKRDLALLQKHNEETRDYYYEMNKQFKIIAEITKKSMSEKVEFLNQLPSDYDEMYNLCKRYADSSDNSVRICAKGLISYLHDLKTAEESINTVLSRKVFEYL